MSSWIRGAKTYAKQAISLPFYYDISQSTNIASTFLELLGAFIYSRKQNEMCAVYDPNGLVNDVLRYNPGIRTIKEVPNNTNQISLPSLITTSKTMKFSEIQKHASSIFQYTPGFNTSIVQVIQKASIRTAFDIAIHITPSESGNIDIAYYVNIVREYQKKLKKASISIYVMADSFQVVTQFQKAGDNGWTIMSLSKFPVTNATDAMFQELAEVQIFAVVPAAVLNFSNSIDRFIYLMQRNAKGYSFFKEVSNREWAIDFIEPQPPVQLLAESLPAPVVAPVAAPVVAPVAEPVPAPLRMTSPLPVAAPGPAPLRMTTSPPLRVTAPPPVYVVPVNRLNTDA